MCDELETLAARNCAVGRARHATKRFRNRFFSQYEAVDSLVTTLCVRAVLNCVNQTSDNAISHLLSQDRGRGTKMDHGANRLFQQSLCESRSVTENLEPTSARLLSDLQKQITKLKGDVEVEKQKSRNIAKDSLGELKRQRDEYERRLEQSLDSLNLRKDQEKAAELKRLEDYLTRQKEQEKKLLIKEKNDEMRELQKKLQKRHDENIKVVLKQQRKLVMEEMQGKLPDEEAVAARESKLARELFSLGEENWRLEDQVNRVVNYYSSFNVVKL